jgi:hypothetical protein
MKVNSKSTTVTTIVHTLTISDNELAVISLALKRLEEDNHLPLNSAAARRALELLPGHALGSTADCAVFSAFWPDARVVPSRRSPLDTGPVSAYIV